MKNISIQKLLLAASMGAYPSTGVLAPPTPPAPNRLSQKGRRKRAKWTNQK